MELERTTYRGFEIITHTDDDPMSPRTEFDNVGTMVCFHRRYDLGDEHNYQDANDIMAHLEDINAIWLPLFLYDHSGITMRTSGFSCPWDSGQVGVIFCTKETAVYAWGKKICSKKVQEQAIAYLQSEVETYNAYISGQVYGYTVEPIDANKEITCDDSCWGFFGEMDYMISEAKGNIDYAIKEWAEGAVIEIKEARKERKRQEEIGYRTVQMAVNW